MQASGMPLADLQAQFPSGKYWNHATVNGYDYNEETFSFIRPRENCRRILDLLLHKLLCRMNIAIL